MDSSVSNPGGSQLPPMQPQLHPGFRFHPTDEELVVHYLKRKAASLPLPAAIIADVDLYKFDPWELPGKAKFGEQEWYFFSPRDRKYPNGARPNRAATSGYWKATGTDKPVLSSVDAAGAQKRVGVKKALVFYGGKPPKGIKTNWIMHEYRLADSSTNTRPPHPHKKASLRLDDWVLCRIYKKSSSSSCMDNELAVSAEQASLLQPLYPHVTQPTISPLQQANPQGRLPQPQYQRQRSGAATANYSSALLDDDDDTFFQGLLIKNTDYDQEDVAHITNTMTCNTAIQPGGSATIAAGGDGDRGNMICRFKPDQFQQQLCLVSPTLQAKRALLSLPPYRYDDADVGNNINPQPPPSKRLQVYNNSHGDGGSNSNSTTSVINSINNLSNNNNNRNLVCNSSGNSSSSTDHTDDNGHTIQTCQVSVPLNTSIAANDRHQRSLLGSLGDGTSQTGFRNLTYQLLSSINWRSSS